MLKFLQTEQQYKCCIYSLNDWSTAVLGACLAENRAEYAYMNLTIKYLNTSNSSHQTFKAAESTTYAWGAETFK